MKKIGKLFVCVLLISCGGSSNKHTVAPAPAPRVAHERNEATSMPQHDSTYASGGVSTTSPSAKAPQPTPLGTNDTTGTIGGTGTLGTSTGTGIGSGTGSAADTDDTATGTGTGTGMGTDATPSAGMGMTDVDKTVAKAELKSVKDGSSMGTITFEKGTDNQITITGDFTGLAKDSVHAIYIHENGDCSKKATKVGKHLNPTHTKHGPPSSGTRHAGDFGNITADDSGAATFTMTTDSVTMEGDRPDSILDRAVVIHAKKDSKSGNAGAAIACGVIEME